MEKQAKKLPHNVTALPAMRGRMAGDAYVVMTPDELRDMFREEIAAALESQKESAPITVSRPGLAKVLGMSTSTVDAMRREGMPEIRAVDSPRFIVTDVLEWLRSRGKDGAA